MRASKTFVVLALVVVVGLRVSAEQPRTTANPCGQPGDRNPRLLPVDEAPSKPDLLAFRVRLQAAVIRRNIEAVIEEIDPGIRLGFDASIVHCSICPPVAGA